MTFSKNKILRPFSVRVVLLSSLTIVSLASYSLACANSKSATGHDVNKLATANSQIQSNTSLDDMMTLQRGNDSLQNAIRPPQWEQDLQKQNLDFNAQMAAGQLAVTQQEVAIKQEELTVAQTETQIAAERQKIANGKTITDAAADQMRGEGDRARGQGDEARGVGKSYSKGYSKNHIYSQGSNSLDIIPVNPND